MTRLSEAEIAGIEAALSTYVPIFFAGKGYERDTLVGTAESGAVAIVVDNPWAGHTGYGLKARFELTPAQARELGLWLLAAAREQGP